MIKINHQKYILYEDANNLYGWVIPHFEITAAILSPVDISIAGVS